MDLKVCYYKDLIEWDLDYEHRFKMTINTTEVIKRGLKYIADYLPGVSKDNKHDITITLGNTKKLSYLWNCEGSEIWEKYKEEFIILDEFEWSSYLISIPVPKDIGKAIYYIYYNISKKFDGKENRLRISGIARSINQIKAIIMGMKGFD